MKEQFLTLINNSNVHRVDLAANGQKNTRDYAYGIAHYSVGDNFKIEVVFTDKTEKVISKIVVKNKTFNAPVATFATAADISAVKHALDNRVLMTRLYSANVAAYNSNLSKLARVH